MEEGYTQLGTVLTDRRLRGQRGRWRHRRRPLQRRPLRRRSAQLRRWPAKPVPDPRGGAAPGIPSRRGAVRHGSAAGPSSALDDTLLERSRIPEADRFAGTGDVITSSRGSALKVRSTGISGCVSGRLSSISWSSSGRPLRGGQLFDGADEIASTRSPILSSGRFRATSAWLTMLIISCPSMTGRRRRHVRSWSAALLPPTRLHRR